MLRIFQAALGAAAVAAVVWFAAHVAALRRAAPPPSPAAPLSAPARPISTLTSSAPPAPSKNPREGEREASVIPPLKFIRSSGADQTPPPPPPNN